MRMLRPALSALAAAVVLVGCSSLRATFDYDTQADFTRLQDYAWMPPADSERASELVLGRVESAVDAGLAAKGYRREEAEPDFLVAARTGRQTRVSVQDYGYQYGPYGTWYPRRDVSIQEYEVGTLILDIVDAGTRRLIWRGTAEDTVDPFASPEQITRVVQGAVDKLLEGFPPE